MASSHSSRHHRRSRTSRWLLVLLVLVVAAGGVVYWRTIRPRLSQARAAAVAAAAPAQPPVLVDPTASHALLSQTPGSQPNNAAVPAAPGTPAKPAPVRLTAPPSPAGPALPGGAAQKPLADAKARSDAGDLIGARAILNAALNTGRLAEADAGAIRHAMADLNAKVIFSPTRFTDPYVELVTVQSVRDLRVAAAQHAVPWEAVCRMNGVSDRRLRAGTALKVPAGPFHLVIGKSAFRMDLYLGGLPGESNALYVSSLPVGLGKDDSTPTGLWSIIPGSKGKNLAWTNPRSNEHFNGDDPKNPLGGFWIGLKGEDGNAVGKTSYGIHGTIEPDSIGKQASMGCIRLRHDDIALVYDLVVEGKTRVLVKD